MNFRRGRGPKSRGPRLGGDADAARQSGPDPLTPSWDLAARGLLRWKARSLLLVLLVGFAVASYLATSTFAAGTRAGTVPEVDLGMGGTLLARMSCDDLFGGTGQSWAYVQLRWLDDPRVYEYPRSERRFRSLMTNEEGGELAILRADGRVSAVWVARLLTLGFPWGTEDLLSLPSGTSAVESLEFAAGRPPAGPLEVALPEETAALTGVELGSEIEILVSDPEMKTLGAYSAATLTVCGVFRGGPAYLQRPLGWIEGGYDVPWLTSIAAHWPRVLENLEPNSYLVELVPGTSISSFVRWFTADEWIDDDGCLHLDTRYPVAHVWSEHHVSASLALAATSGMAPFAGIMLLALVFVAVGVFTIFILSFLDRRREIAILKTIGLTGTNIATVFWLEAGCVALLGLLVGIAGAALLLRTWFGVQLGPGMAVRAVLVTGLVVFASCVLPVAMARVATVNELLGGRRVTAVFRRRVGAIDGGTLAGGGSGRTRTG